MELPQFVAGSLVMALPLVSANLLAFGLALGKWRKWLWPVVFVAFLAASVFSWVLLHRNPMFVLFQPFTRLWLVVEIVTLDAFACAASWGLGAFPQISGRPAKIALCCLAVVLSRFDQVFGLLCYFLGGESSFFLIYNSFLLYPLIGFYFLFNRRSR